MTGPGVKRPRAVGVAGGLVVLLAAAACGKEKPAPTPADGGGDAGVHDVGSPDAGGPRPDAADADAADVSDACTPACAARQCGPDGCGGVCPTPCDAQCGLAEDFVAQHGVAIRAALDDGDWLFEVPPTRTQLVVGSAELCPDGGCYLTLEIASTLAVDDPRRVSLDLLVVARGADATYMPMAWPFEVDLGVGSVDCTMTFDTAFSGEAEIVAAATATFTLEAATGGGTLAVSGVSLDRSYDDDDIAIAGGASCVLDALATWVDGNLRVALQRAVEQVVAVPACVSCESPTDCIGGETCVDGICESVTDGSCRVSSLVPLCAL